MTCIPSSSNLGKLYADDINLIVAINNLKTKVATWSNFNNIKQKYIILSKYQVSGSY